LLVSVPLLAESQEQLRPETPLVGLGIMQGQLPSVQRLGRVPVPQEPLALGQEQLDWLPPYWQVVPVVRLAILPVNCLRKEASHAWTPKKWRYRAYLAQARVRSEHFQ
jgi:hypothetical protein